jgi:hypothetical protein
MVKTAMTTESRAMIAAATKMALPAAAPVTAPGKVTSISVMSMGCRAFQRCLPKMKPLWSVTGAMPPQNEVV